MVLSSSVTEETFQGDGFVRRFPFSFKAWPGELGVFLSGLSGEETDVTAQSRLECAAAGGWVVYPADPEAPALGIGQKLTVVRQMKMLQETRFLNAALFDPRVIEERLDKLAATDQQLYRLSQRAVKVPRSSSETPERLWARMEQENKNLLEKALRLEDGLEAILGFMDRAGHEMDRRVREMDAVAQQRLKDLEASSVQWGLTLEQQLKGHLERVYQRAGMMDSDLGQARSEMNRLLEQVLDQALVAASSAERAARAASGIPGFALRKNIVLALRLNEHHELLAFYSVSAERVKVGDYNWWGVFPAEAHIFLEGGALILELPYA